MDVPPLHLGGLIKQQGAEKQTSEKGHSHVQFSALGLQDCSSPSSPSPSTELANDGHSPRSDVSIEDWGYEDLRCMLGSGSLGVVRSVRNHADGQAYACKHVRSVDLEQTVSLRREYDVLSLLAHENVVRPKAFYSCFGNAWLCMELCQGGSLEEAVEAKGCFEEPRARPLALQLLRGIEYLHYRRVVHRDIKPSNLLLDSEATSLKIADFGSAQQIGCAAAGLAMLSERGTQLYSAPELRFGLQWNERVDEWAAGLCVFYLLRAELPFNAELRKVKRQLLERRQPRIQWGGIGAGMRNLLRQALTVEMRDRPSAMELSRHSALGHSPPRSPPRTSALGTWSPAAGLLFEVSRASQADQRPLPAAERAWEAALDELVRAREARHGGPPARRSRPHLAPC